MFIFDSKLTLFISILCVFACTAFATSNIEGNIEMGNCSIGLPPGFEQSKRNIRNYRETSKLRGGLIKNKTRTDKSLDRYLNKNMFTLVYSEKINGLKLYIYSYIIGDSLEELGVLASSSHFLEIFNSELPFMRELALKCESQLIIDE